MPIKDISESQTGAFLAENKIEDGIMRKDTTTAKLTPYEIERNKKISKIRYMVEQYFGLSHLHDHAYQGSVSQHPQKQVRLLVPTGGVQYKKRIENFKTGVHIKRGGAPKE